MYKGDKWQYYDCIYLVARIMLEKDKSAYMVQEDDLTVLGMEVLDKCVLEFNDSYGCSFRVFLDKCLLNRYRTEIWKLKNRSKYHKYVCSNDGVELLEKEMNAVIDYSASVEKQVIRKIMTAEKESQVINAFKFILESHRDIWVAYYYEDLTMQKIARIYGSRYDTIKRILDDVSSKLLYILENNEMYVC